MIPLHDILRKANCGDNKKISGCRRSYWSKMKSRAQDFSSSENILYDIIMVGICPYRFVQTHSVSPRMSPKVNYRLWVIVVYQCRFILGNKCIILVSSVDNGGCHVCVEVGSMFEISVPS